MLIELCIHAFVRSGANRSNKQAGPDNSRAESSTVSRQSYTDKSSMLWYMLFSSGVLKGICSLAT